MDSKKYSSSVGAPFLGKPFNVPNILHGKKHFGDGENATCPTVCPEVDIDFREVYFLIMHFLSTGPCQRTFREFWNELSEHQLLPRRYHACFLRSGVHSGDDRDDGISLPLSYDELVERHPHIDKHHLLKLLKQLILSKARPLMCKTGDYAPNAADVPTLLGTGSFSLLNCDRDLEFKQVKPIRGYLRWPHMQADQVSGLSLREIGGGFTKHHRAPSIRSACYAIAKPSTMVQKMEINKKLRGHRNAVYCAIFDRSGRYVITGSDDRLVKIWSMETAFCLASCRGHEGDITDLAVNSNNALVASASNDFVIRIWRLPDGMPISVLQGHTGVVTAIAFSPRPSALFQLLSSSDDGTCRIWDARYSQCLRIYIPKPPDTLPGKSSGPLSYGPSSNLPQSNQILCCAYNANGTVFVTGSSDTFARVWSAPKSVTDELEQPPMNEMDVLAGHENDVNYVQFSGCAVASKSSMSDNLREDIFPKFKNSWFCHDNIVTCSRDGSAIIWVPRSRRSHGKSGRWTRAYHLKVPPPPLPPQPPRGGPRHRFLPSPRGVNMIVWSLDNRFVLAAIMDCRICVWNAVDGSLVHSLTGHNGYSYVLDVHPFNPRIAMSAGYDGRTIVWDIWEGTPVRVYELGPYKLVDGKFSPDGTSIVLSDDVGQIYLLNTGEGESQKDAKFDQFFLGDYRPLIRDSQGHVLDQETQLAPYRRNIQDLLCDSSMIPYPQSYQYIYQKRRLGALGMEWKPSSLNFAVGLDANVTQDFPLLPLVDLERISEPLPEFIDAMYWEPENEIPSNDTDSEYHLTEELSEDEQESIHAGSSCASESNTEGSDFKCRHKDDFRRSRRKKHSKKVELTTSSGRRVKKRNSDESGGQIFGSSRTKKSKTSQKNSKTKSSKRKKSRTQRTAARNALNMMSDISESSIHSVSNEDSEDYTSDSESVSLDSKSERYDTSLHSMQETPPKEEQQFLNGSEVKHSEPSGSESIVAKKKLVLKFSLQNCKKHAPPADTKFEHDNQDNQVLPASLPQMANQDSKTFVDTNNEQSELTVDHLKSSVGISESNMQTTEVSESIDAMMTDMPTRGHDMFSVPVDNKNDINGYPRTDEEYGKVSSGDGEHMEAFAQQNVDCAHKELVSPNDTLKSSSYASSLSLTDLQGGNAKGKVDILETNGINPGTNDFRERKDAVPHKLIKLIIKKKILADAGNSSKVRDIRTVVKLRSDEDDLMQKGKLCMEQGLSSDLLKDGEDAHASRSFQLLHSYSGKETYDVAHVRDQAYKAGTSSEGFTSDVEEVTTTHDSVFMSESVADANRRTRSMKMKATSPLQSSVTFKGRGAMGSSRNALTFSVKMKNQVSQTTRSTRSQQVIYNNETPSSSRRQSNHKKLSWIMLSEPDAHRYVPQFGDEVVYLRQGHEEFIDSCVSSEKGPWRSMKGNLRAVEYCKIECLDYATVPSGESCCKITLKFTDPSSNVHGKAFTFTLPELTDFPDFVVERARYDDAIRRNWSPTDKCFVWWGNENGEGGSWWEGLVVSSVAKSDDFPDSPWERYEIEYKAEGSHHHHSPWELQDTEFMCDWEQPQIDSKSRDKLLSVFIKLTESSSRDEDHYIFQKLNKAAQKSDFINRFPYPIHPDLIQLRLKNNYYRSLEAVNHDIRVMTWNAESFFKNKSDLSAIADLSKFLTRKLNRLLKD